MRAVILLSTVCLTAYAATAAAQRRTAAPAAKPAAAQPAQHAGAAITSADVAGNWRFQNTVKNSAGQDTVVTSVLTISADGKKWVTHLVGREPITVRVLSMAGDSVVTESGPFQSVARAGQTVTTKETFHFNGDAAWGTIEASYSNGQVVKGTIKGTRKK
jgi:hypothetical protein